jgi:Trypsin-co-occurring domain 2
LTNESVNGDWASLSDAIEALRDDLAKAWYDGRKHQVRFKIEPVELTVQVGVTRTGEGSAGIKWHVLTLGGQRKHETAATQTLTLRLQPVFYEENGRRLAGGQQQISDVE